MRVRALDAGYDMQFGRGQANFLRDVPAAPGQCVLTRLMLYRSEWFLNTKEGTPWRTDVLGKRTNATRDPAMRARVLGTKGITAIRAYASQIDRRTRGYSVQVTLDTVYGQIQVAAPSTAPNVDVRYGR